MNFRDIQVWDNAAFDNAGISDTSTTLNSSWSHINNNNNNNNNRSFESDCSKENLTPSLVDSAVSPNSKPLKMITNVANKTGVLEERNLDFEIQEIEKEITRLSTRLESLRLEKAKRNAELIKKKPKIMEPTKRGVRGSDEELKNVKTPNRRGVSLGPAEIMRGMRRGISLGPAEITPVHSSASRRKSCYWKLQDIDELRVTKERGKTMSLSPKSRSKTITKPQNQNLIPNKAATAIGINRSVKKQDGVLSSIQPKKLFVKDGDKSGAVKKPFKSGRVVPSRYNQITSGGSSALKELRKRSWPENEDEGKRSEKKRVSLVSKSDGADQQPGTDDSKVKKRWDVLEAVPRIKTNRCVMESPRDSGPAKRVSQLVGKKSFFSMDDGGENPDTEVVCQALNFEQEQQAGKEYLKIRVLRAINESPRDSGAAKRVSQLVGRKPFFAVDHDDHLPVFSFEEDDEN
ncbi:uncharacterized protein LOC141599836 [Silene latifolia]|uniref:uncharacterized protein LOC141599836 n=1 Tax=Silene latifolia TaxID=37657 RepID=UPI003D786ED7